MLQCSCLSARLTQSCVISGRRCLTCDTTNPFLKAFRSSCTLSFRCFCELEHACLAQWWIHVITYVCTEVLLTLMLKISDCSSIALNQDPQAFSLHRLTSELVHVVLVLHWWEWTAGSGHSHSLAVTTQQPNWAHVYLQVNLQATVGLYAFALTQQGYVEKNLDVNQIHTLNFD